MNSNGLDIVSVIFLGIAVVIFLYLRSILGSRTGNERRPYDPLGGESTENNRPRDMANDGKVVTMPERRDQEADHRDEPEIDRAGQIAKFAAEGTPLAQGLNEIVNADPDFEPEGFMKGAERAYEMIITAFSEGEKSSLKRLLAKDVFAGFSAAIDEREQKGEEMVTQFVGFDQVTLLEAELENKMAEITVKFKSSLIRYLIGSDGELVEGDEKSIEKVTDIWTFSRPVTGRDPNWKLISTKSES